MDASDSDATGVLIVPLRDAFGWSRATTSLAVSINLVLAIDRRPRRRLARSTVAGIAVSG